MLTASDRRMCRTLVGTMIQQSGWRAYVQRAVNRLSRLVGVSTRLDLKRLKRLTRNFIITEDVHLRMVPYTTEPSVAIGQRRQRHAAV